MTTLNVTLPKWAGKPESAARKVQPILGLVSEVGKTVTPAQVEAVVGEGYTSKFMSLLRAFGFEFEATKEGRKVVSYEVTAVPANLEDIKAVGPKVAKAKAEPKEKAEKAKPEKKAATKKTTTKAKKGAKKVARKAKEVDEDEVEFDINSSGEISLGTIDEDFDSLEGLDLSNLVE